MNHKKQRLATLKRLKRGDDNELERNLRLEKVVARSKKKEEQDWRMMHLPKDSGWPWSILLSVAFYGHSTQIQNGNFFMAPTVYIYKI